MLFSRMRLASQWCWLRQIRPTVARTAGAIGSRPYSDLEAQRAIVTEFVDPYSNGQATQSWYPQSARTGAHPWTAIGDKVANRWHLQFAQRWVVSASTSTIGWPTACAEKSIRFKQLSNAFLSCAAPDRLQELANSLTPRDLVTCGQKWLAYFTPFFTAREREQAGCQHRLFFSQVEYCDNLIFRRRAALDNLGQRLLDANRTIGQPNKITVIFVARSASNIEASCKPRSRTWTCPTLVISQPLSQRLHQAVRSRSPHPPDRGSEQQRQRLRRQESRRKIYLSSKKLYRRSTITTSTSSRISWKPLVDRGQLRKLAEPTITSTGKRIPGLKLDHPRQLALMACACTLRTRRRGNTFTTAEIHPAVIEALGLRPESYTLASLRYDLSKLRAKGLVAKLPNSRRYQLLPHGYSICLVFLKLFERVYAPLTAGLLSPIKSDARLESQRRSQLDRLYQSVIDDLDTLVRASVSKPRDSTLPTGAKIHVTGTITA